MFTIRGVRLVNGASVLKAGGSSIESHCGQEIFILKYLFS